MSSTKKIVTINLIVFFLLIVFVETIFHIRELINPAQKYPTLKEFRLTRPEPYKESSFFSEEFINESFEQPKGWRTLEETRIVLPNDYQGKFFNVRNSIRVTTGQHAQSRRNIYIFGGSTLYGSEVPDDYTIASQLQRILNEKKLSINVYNYGVTSIHAGQQLERLKYDVKLKRKDIVIFYDGVNDVTQRVYYGNPDGWIANEALKAPAFVRGARRLISHSAFFRWLDNNFLTKKDYKFSQDTVLAAAQGYVETIKASYQYSIDQGTVFYHFLQPNLTTRSPLNKYEKELLQMKGVTAEGMVDAFKLSYPVFRNQLVFLQYSSDLSQAFNHLENSPYLDICHVNEVANKVIANAIFDVVENEVKSSN